MTSSSSKAIPFVVLVIAGGMIGVDSFTDYSVDDDIVSFAEVILAPLGLGGLANKGLNVYREVKAKGVQHG